MKLRYKVKREGRMLSIETAVEYDDGTFHPHTSTLTLEHRWPFIRCTEWQTLLDIFGKEAEGKHLVNDLGARP